MTATTLPGAGRHSDAWAAQPFASRLCRRIRLLDAGMVLLAIGFVLWAGWGSGDSLLADQPRQFLAVTVAILWPVMLWQGQATATTILGQGLEEYRRVVVAGVWTTTIAAALAYATDTTRARGFLVGTFAVGVVLLLLERHLMRLHLHRLMAGGNPLHRVFVIASACREQDIREALAGKDSRFSVVGGHRLNGGEPDPGEIVRAATTLGADTILYSPLGTEDTHWTRRLGWAMEESDLSLLVSPSLVEIAGPRLSVEPVEGLAFVRVDMPRFSGPARVVKRAMDIAGATLALLVFGIPMLVIAGLIRRDSDGPAIFKQTRAGIRSETFQCWKFRTMYTGADAQRAALRAAETGTMADGATFKMADDPRVTKVGKWLRRFSIDELPQLVNCCAAR